MRVTPRRLPFTAPQITADNMTALAKKHERDSTSQNPPPVSTGTKTPSSASAATSSLTPTAGW